MLRMEGAVAARTRGGDQRILTSELRLADLRVVGLLVVRQRILAPGLVQNRVGLDLTSNGVEARLAVEAEHALGVLLVLEAMGARLVDALLAELVEGHAELAS